MAITWQNVAQPNTGGVVSNVANATELVSGGLDRLSQVAGNQRQKQLKNERAELHNSLLDLAVNPDVGEKEFMGKAVRMGKDSGLTPEQAMAEVDRIQSIYNAAGALTEDQKQDTENRRLQIDATIQAGQVSIANALKQFDNRNPQLNLVSQDIEAFNTEPGGLANVMQELRGQIEHKDDAVFTIEELNKLQADGNYSDWAVAKTIKELGVESPNWLWDASLVDSGAYKKRLKANQEKYDQGLLNSEKRASRKAQLQLDHARNVSKLQEELQEFIRNTQSQNRQNFAGSK